MSWVRLDDSFYEHPKFIGIDPAAGFLWARTLAWSSRLMTDGHIPTAVASHHGATAAHIDELVGRGLWITVEGGWQIHDYLGSSPVALDSGQHATSRQTVLRRCR